MVLHLFPFFLIKNIEFKSTAKASCYARIEGNQNSGPDQLKAVTIAGDRGRSVYSRVSNLVNNVLQFHDKYSLPPLHFTSVTGIPCSLTLSSSIYISNLQARDCWYPGSSAFVLTRQILFLALPFSVWFWINHFASPCFSFLIYKKSVAKVHISL